LSTANFAVELGEFMSQGQAVASRGENAQFLAHLNSDGRSQLLREHLVSVSEAAGHLAAKLGIGPAGAAIGLLHDLGKYSNDFQQYLRRVALDNSDGQYDSERGTVDHSTAGAQRIWRDLRHLYEPEASGGNDRVMDGIVGEFLALCIASHHSGLIDCIAPDGLDNLSRRMNKTDSASHYGEACSSADEQVRERIDDLLKKSELVSCVRDKITKIHTRAASETICRFNIGLIIRFLFSCLIDADRTDTADSSNSDLAGLRQYGNYAKWDVLIGRLDKTLAQFSSTERVDQIRKLVSEDCLDAADRAKGIFTLTVPTGGGKTLASLRFALNHAVKWRMERIVYISPYISIIDQNADVVRTILEPRGCEFASVVLEHHSNLTPLKETKKSKLLSENWDAPVVFTTAVQLLETLFGAGTRAARRMHQLANSVLIFDEVQTIPVRCVHLFNNALNFLVEQCGATVLLCTATQPLLNEVDSGKGAVALSNNAELMPDVKTLFANLRRYEAYDRRKPGGWEYTEAADLAISEASSSGSCLVVANTKREVLSIFKLCREKAKPFVVYHLSTNMCPAHRMKILKEIKKHLDGQKQFKEQRSAICVSTQLIEAGVDIDFGTVIRALAGLDSIAQAAGRCNRNGTRRMTGRVHVINLVGELPKALSEIRAGQEASHRVLDEQGGRKEVREIDLSDTKIIEQYFRYYFFDRKSEMSYRVTTKQAERDDTLLNMLGENQLAVAEGTSRMRKPPEIYLRQCFMTAAKAFEPIEADTQGVIVPYSIEGKTAISELCSAFEVKKQVRLLKRAQQFSVNVFPWVMKELQRAEAVHEVQEATGILYLDEKYYSADFGLSVDGTEEMEFQNG
jgi:CRISPR-associated endonuclease/helicase Cas3